MMGDIMDKRKTFAIFVAAVLLIGAIILLFSGERSKAPHVPTIDLPADYMVLVDSPENEEDLMFIAALSSIVVHDGYHPLFILENGSLSNYQLWTIEHLENNDVPKLLFTNDENVIAEVSAQVDNIEVFERNPHTLMDFKGFDGTISVGSYKEALWVAPLANYDNKMITIGKSTYEYQEDVWGELESRGVSADYVVITNPEDYRSDIFYTEGTSYKNDGNPAPATPYNASFHIPSMSAVAAEIAAYHQAYVLTDIVPSTDEIGYMDVELNKVQIGTYLKLREMYDNFGPMEYICIVGSAEAVPQFELPDETGAEGDAEGDALISSDMMYGFMSDDIYHMNVAVGRIINMNVAAASNQMVRTYAYDRIVDTVEVDYSNTGSQTVNWRKQASVWNGYEVADQRLQMRPGWEATRDFEDEGYSVEYMRTTGNEGAWGSVVDPGSATETVKETEIKPIMESSGFTVYRGHGSWHATFYTWEPEEANDPQSKTRLEGNDQVHPDSLVDYYLPPQVSILVSCENNKIHGLHWWGAPIDLQMSFPLNFFNSGGVGLIAATEVSYSNLAQDPQTFGGYFTGNYNWDKNNCWFAFPLDGLINHEDEYGTLGKAGMWAENRYMNNPNKDFQVSPFERISDADGKEVAMFVVYGDPSFSPEPNNSGANNVDPWHNGPEDE
jgi:archaellum component FlaF (FlaF/FlaG flagellin family)